MTNTGIAKIAVFALATATMMTPMAAKAAPPAPTYGSAAILTNRNCIVTADGDCQLGSRNFTQYAGGAGSSFSTSATNEAGAGASGSAYSSFSANAVPTLGVASFAGPNTRTGTTALAYQTYAYNGSAAINLALAGTLHYFGSGNLVASTVNGVEPGGRGVFNANLSILPVWALSDIGTSAEDLINGLSTANDCGFGPTANAFANSFGLGAGEHTIGLSLTTSCSGGAITINPGESFVILSTVQAISNLGGYVDALNTFSAFFDPDQTVFTDSGEKVGATFLAESIAATPEPATWAQMILGFAVIGLAKRRGHVGVTSAPLIA